MSPLSIIFCGTPDFAVPSLEALAGDESFEVKLVVTQPDRPVGRKQELTPPAVKVAAQKLGLRVIQPEQVNSELPALLEREPDLKPDFLVVVAYGELLSDKTLSLPAIAPLNVHGSILPRWRGASPVEHAILHNDAETGVTVQVMVKELDAGPILSIARFPIGARDTAFFLRDQLCHIGAMLLKETLKQPLDPQPQPRSGITICRKLTKEDGKADHTTLTAEEIDRKVRALVPWPGVTIAINGQDLKIIESDLEAQTDSVPLPCARGSLLHLIRVQPAGKKEMSGADWMRGMQ